MRSVQPRTKWRRNDLHPSPIAVTSNPRAFRNPANRVVRTQGRLHVNLKTAKRQPSRINTPKTMAKVMPNPCPEFCALRFMASGPGGMSGERVRRIELPYAAWEAAVLPLNYTRLEEVSFCRGAHASKGKLGGRRRIALTPPRSNRRDRRVVARGTANRARRPTHGRSRR